MRSGGAWYFSASLLQKRQFRATYNQLSFLETHLLRESISASGPVTILAVELEFGFAEVVSRRG
jgi:hypothetical protein